MSKMREMDSSVGSLSWYYRHKDDPEYKAKKHRYISEYWKKNKDILRVKHTEWTRKNRDYVRWYRRTHMSWWFRERRQKLKEWWKGEIKRVPRSLALKAEEIGSKLLEIEGFTDILHLGRYNGFDYLAKKDGRICAVEITTTMTRTLRKPALLFAKYFDMEIYVLFVKPDLTMYKLMKPKTKHARIASQNGFKQIPQVVLNG